MQAIGENPDIELIEENQCQEGRIFDTFENRIGQEVIAEEERERMAINRNLQ